MGRVFWREWDGTKGKVRIGRKVYFKEGTRILGASKTVVQWQYHFDFFDDWQSVETANPSEIRSYTKTLFSMMGVCPEKSQSKKQRTQKEDPAIKRSRAMRAFADSLKHRKV